MAFDLDDQELYYTRKYLANKQPGHISYKKQKEVPEMILPKKDKKTQIELGTTYDKNKTLVKKYEKKLTTEELKNKLDNFKTYIQYTNEKYYMLLCNDKKDYTVFHLNNINDIDFMFNELCECLTNRGDVYGFDKTQDEQAFEIWLVINDEAYCYYFFGYENAVIEC